MVKFDYHYSNEPVLSARLLLTEEFDMAEFESAMIRIYNRGTCSIKEYKELNISDIQFSVNTPVNRPFCITSENLRDYGLLTIEDAAIHNVSVIDNKTVSDSVFDKLTSILTDELSAFRKTQNIDTCILDIKGYLPICLNLSDSLILKEEMTIDNNYFSESIGRYTKDNYGVSYKETEFTLLPNGQICQGEWDEQTGNFGSIISSCQAEDFINQALKNGGRLLLNENPVKPISKNRNFTKE